MDSQQFRKAAHAAIDEIIDYYDTIESRRVVADVEPGYLRQLLPDGPPETGESWDEIQKDISSKIMPGLTHWQSPKFMAFFPTASTYPAMLGELYSAAFSAPAFNWICSPVVTELETIVLDWLARALHLPSCYCSSSEGGGVIQGSASESVVVVVVAARERYLKQMTSHLDGQERESDIVQRKSRLVVLASEMSHSCVQKAAVIAGTKFKVILAGVKENCSMTGENLIKTLEECRKEGLEPFFLSTTLGTTSTCAVDNFDEIVEVTRDRPEIWKHIDAAWAGSALVCEEYQHLTQQFTSFDSFDVNMHKWLLTNFDASCLYVKHRRHLTDALSLASSIMKNKYSDSGLVTDYRDWQIPLGRRFRALKIWFVMRTYGVSGMKAYIRNGIQLGELFHSLICSRPDLFRPFSKPAFALTAFSVVSPATPSSTSSGTEPSKLEPDEALTDDANGIVGHVKVHGSVYDNPLTREVYEAVNEQGEIFITSTVVGDQTLIRVVSANSKAEEKYVRRAFEIMVETTEEVLRKRGLGAAQEKSQPNGSV